MLLDLLYVIVLYPYLDKESGLSRGDYELVADLGKGMFTVADSEA